MRAACLEAAAPAALGGGGPHVSLSPARPPRRYPYNLDFDYGPLEGLQKFCINNLGDPFIESNYGVHSREFEVRRAAGRGAVLGCCY